MNSAQLDKKLDDLKEATRVATQAVQAHTGKLVGMVEGLPCNSWELLALLDELADADEDCSQHFVRFDNERGVPHTESSQECRDDWSRCHDRRMTAQAKLTRFARALRTGQAEAA